MLTKDILQTLVALLEEVPVHRHLRSLRTTGVDRRRPNQAAQNAQMNHGLAVEWPEKWNLVLPRYSHSIVACLERKEALKFYQSS